MAGEGRSPQSLLKQLCCKITGRSEEAVLPFYKIAVAQLGGHSASDVFPDIDEFAVGEKIKRKLARQGREKDAAIFAEKHRQLQKLSSVIHNRSSILYLLLLLSRDQKKSQYGAASFYRGIATQSTPYVPAPRQPPATPSQTMLHMTRSSGATSSGISSIQPSLLDSRDPTPQSYAPSYFMTPATVRPVLPSAVRGRLPPQEHLHFSRISASGQSTVSSRTVPMTTSGTRGQGDTNTSFEVPEGVLVRELVYVLQGIECDHIKYLRNKDDGFCINPEVGIPRPTRLLLSRLVECGFLYNKISRFITSHVSDRSLGTIGQSFCSALQVNLNGFLGLLAQIEAQLYQEDDPGIETASALTLRKLQVLLNQPTIRFKALGALVEQCQGKKGGALASVIHSHMQHGDPAIVEVMRYLLARTCGPIVTTIMRWIYDGQLDDTYHEFFVASDPQVKDDRLWHDKYQIRKGMVPSYLTEEQANKILLTGKSINFLRQVCHDATSIQELDVVRKAETNKVEAIFQQDVDGDFQRMIDVVYTETSQHLLDIMHTKYHFLEHLKAMRRYLLLGQGDFIRHLMDLLEDDLAKSASELYAHNLTGILETAIRATNAQFDEPDILQRLDVRLLEVSPGDTGWDVFSLDYHVDGPIRTVFSPECVTMYLRVFNFLWRAKRMEYILSGIWKGQTSNARLLKSMPELKPLLHQCHIMACEMVHFVQQMQYYLNFEVLECSWDSLLTQVQEAKDLDNIITAHQVFLDTVLRRSLLDSSSTAILAQLRTIFDLIIKFQGVQDNMYEAALEELQRRQLFEKNKQENTRQGTWGLTAIEEDTHENRKKAFKQDVMSSVGSQLRVLQPTYQNMVQKFLQLLTAHEDPNLRFLSFRLDFNEWYKDRNITSKSPRNLRTQRRTVVT